MNRSLPFRALVLGLVVVALVVSSCSGGLTPAAYAEAAGRAATDYEAATDALREVYAESIRGPLENVVALQQELETREPTDEDTALLAAESQRLLETMVDGLAQLYDSSALELDGFIAALDELDPPSAVSDAHEEFVATLSRWRSTIPGLVASLPLARSLREVEGLINSSDFGDTQPRVTALCLELEQAVAREGVELELHCSDAAGQ